MKLKLIGAALSLALLCTACGATNSQPESTAAPSPTPEAVKSATFKDAAAYDYENYTDSQGIDETGMFTGVKALDYVTLPENYKTLTLSTADVTPTDDMIKVALDSVVGQYAPAANGDTVNIDYVGSVDGVEFMGGNTNGMGSNLTLGSGQFIPGFEEQIVGHKVGEHFDIKVTFPDDYRDSTDGAGNPVKLAGKEAVFAITLNHISFSWELTDEWVKENLKDETYDVSTVEQLKNYITDTMKDTLKENAALNNLYENCKFGEVAPEPVLDYMVCRYLAAMNQYPAMEGTTLEAFLQERGFASIDELLAYNEEGILNAVRSQLMLQAVAEDAGLTLDTQAAAQYDKYVESYGQPYVNQYALNRQAIQLIVDGAKVE